MHSLFPTKQPTIHVAFYMSLAPTPLLVDISRQQRFIDYVPYRLMYLTRDL